MARMHVSGVLTATALSIPSTLTASARWPGFTLIKYPDASSGISIQTSTVMKSPSSRPWNLSAYPLTKSMDASTL